MEIECPRCATSAAWEEPVLRTGASSWVCPSCRRGWEVRTVFFESEAGWPDASFKQRVRALRTEQGMTQGELGELVGISAAYVSTIEHGRRRPPAAMGRRILEALGAHEEIP